MSLETEKLPAESKDRKPWQFKPGVSPNPGGRPRTLVEIERMLNAEHRNVENMREVFARLRALAMGDVVEVTAPKTGKVIRVELRAAPEFMKLYLDRVLGPVREVDVDLESAPPEVIDWLRAQA